MRRDVGIDVGAHVEKSQADRRRDVTQIDTRRERSASLILECRLIDLLRDRIRVCRRAPKPRSSVADPALSEACGRGEINNQIRLTGRILPNESADADRAIDADGSD